MMKLTHYAGFVLTCLMMNIHASAGEQVQLVKDGHACCSIVADNPEVFSVQRLIQFLAQAARQGPKTISIFGKSNPFAKMPARPDLRDSSPMENLLQIDPMSSFVILHECGVEWV